MPKASIIIPCYNAERYLAATVQSALAQTMGDIEIICVDNNSTDGTPKILKELARQDHRIVLAKESEPGEGPTRDHGRALASGEWLYFLDSDDIMEPTLLEHAMHQGEQDDSDIVIFRTTYLDDKTSERRPCPECFDTSWIRNWADVSRRVFSPADNPERIFNSFQNWVHNKLFRASFVREHNLVFQHVKRMADILFTCRALSETKRISLLDESLHFYRCNNQNSALYTADASPLDFYQAFLALRASLEDNGTWQLYHDSFVNWAEEAVAMNVYRAKSFESFAAIVNAMKSKGLARLDITNFPIEKAFVPIRHECCMRIAEKDLAEIAFHYFVLERRHMNDLETQLSEIRTSTTFKVGEKLVSPFAKVKDRLGK